MLKTETRVKEYKPKSPKGKRRDLSNDAKWLLLQIESAGGPKPYWKFCVAWAREMGTNGNVVVWPKRIVSRALNELLENGLVSYAPPERGGSTA